MRIKEVTQNLVDFETLKPGDIFQWNDKYYLKMKTNHFEANAVYLDEFYLVEFFKDTKVKFVNGTLEIER